MPYKHNILVTIVRKSNYHKVPLANFSVLRPGHSVQTGGAFHLTVIFLNSGENSNATVHLGGFWKKGITFRGIPFF